MPTFAIKQTPAGDKLRGGYYTPEPIAHFLASWVAEAGPRLLEPSCGDGAVLMHLGEKAGRDQVVGVELFPEEAEKAVKRSGVKVHREDFFTWFTADRQGTFDGVAGNPPYIRFGSWDEKFRLPALDLMRTQGMRPNRLTNAWVPFVVGSLLAVRPGGRVALVLPAELLQVGYAAALRSYLIDRCCKLTVISFTRLVFQGILQEVVLLLAERGQGPASIRTSEVTDLSKLRQLSLAGTSAKRAHLHESEKWTKYYLNSEAIESLRRARNDGRLSPLRRYAEVDVGVVTGRNSFFCLTAADARHRGLLGVTVPLVSRSHQLSGLTLTTTDLAGHESSDVRTRLLALPGNFDPDRNARVAAYLHEGHADGVPTGYKCRIRRKWWQVPSAWIPDGFMLRQISTHPRLTANMAGATCTDTVHRMRTMPGVSMDRLATAAYNSVTFALAEVLGRSYGGGILELEPSEAEDLPVPDPELISPTVAQKVDELVRERRVTDALDLVDQAALIEGLGFQPTEVSIFRAAWSELRDRRAGRGKRTG